MDCMKAILGTIYRQRFDVFIEHLHWLMREDDRDGIDVVKKFTEMIESVIQERAHSADGVGSEGHHPAEVEEK